MAKRRQVILDSIRKKLQLIRAAALHQYPVGDIDSMLAEIESGYDQETQPES